MAKKIKLSHSIKLTQPSASFSVGSMTLSSTPNMLVISQPGTNNELLKITSESEIFYNVNGEMIKVNCPDDVAEAFIHTIFGVTNLVPDDVIIQKYINKILNHERSNEYINKLEKIFRKFKLEKINEKR
jgi:hypothetical protein